MDKKTRSEVTRSTMLYHAAKEADRLDAGAIADFATWQCCEKYGGVAGMVMARIEATHEPDRRGPLEPNSVY